VLICKLDYFSLGGMVCSPYQPPRVHKIEAFLATESQPPTPNTGVPLFWKQRLVPMLLALTSPECVRPPVAVTLPRSV
jgi:hypothetical protein